MGGVYIESNIEEVRKVWNAILERAKCSENIVLVGAAYGTDVQSLLEEKGYKTLLYFDNGEAWCDSIVNGVKVVKPYKITGSNTMYIICAIREGSRSALKQQLIELGISESDILFTPQYKRDTTKLKDLNVQGMMEEISNLYEANLGIMPNFKNPKTYTEIVNVNKMQMNAPKCVLAADKYRVKEYIKATIGEQYVVPMYGVWDRAEDIDYDSLPDKFVLKTNHASGRNIIVQNKRELNIEETNHKLNAWLKENYGYNGFSLQYRDIVPKIICEEYLDGLAETVYDYQFLCFNGEPKYIWCINGSHRVGCRASFYDLDWNLQPFSVGYPRDDVPAPKPQKLKEMIDISKELSKNFEHVRVDLYEMPDGRVLFGEMTFQTFGGLRKFYPPQYDLEMGKLFNR